MGRKAQKIQILSLSIVGCCSKIVPAGLTDGHNRLWGRNEQLMSARITTHKTKMVAFRPVQQGLKLCIMSSWGSEGSKIRHHATKDKGGSIVCSG